MKRIIRSIDEMPTLKAQLGKARTDRIRYYGKADLRKQPNSTNVANTVLTHMQTVEPYKPGCPIADVLYGVAHMDNNQSKPLSIDRLYTVLQCIELINTREVMSMMAVDKRQAQRYVRAIKFALPHISSLV